MTRPTLSEIEAKSLANRAAHAPRRVVLMPDKLDGRGKDAKPRIARPKRPAKPKKQYPKEHDEQVMLINYWRGACKGLGLDERSLFCIPNSSKLSGGGRIYKWAEGLRSGVPDLMLAVPQHGVPDCAAEVAYSGLFIEMKRIGGAKPETEQSEYHDLLRAQGYKVAVCYGHRAAIDVITAYLGVR